jgi:hypothetical protein
MVFTERVCCVVTDDVMNTVSNAKLCVFFHIPKLELGNDEWPAMNGEWKTVCFEACASVSGLLTLIAYAKASVSEGK